MRSILILVLLVFAFVIGEQNLNARVNTELKMATSIITKANNSTDIGAKKCEIIKKHSFSRQDRKDTFKLIYNCENLEDSISFKIISFSGDLIYERRFLGVEFYDYGRPWYEYVTDTKRGKNFDPYKLSSQISDSLHQADLQYLKLRMDKFFNDEKFIDNPMMKLDKKNLNEFHYEGIEGDPTVIGFGIQLFVEGFEMIAYSKKLQKVLFIAASD